MEENTNLTVVYDLLKKYGLPEITDEIKDKLGELGVDCVDDLAALNAEQLKGLGLKPAKVNRLLDEARKLSEGEKPETAMAPSGPVMGGGAMTPMAAAVAPGMVALPQVPDTETMLRGLKISGKLAPGVNPSVCIALVQAAVATPLDLMSIPKRLLNRLEKKANELDVPVGEVFFDIVAEINKSKYSEILPLVTGGRSPGITASWRKNLANRVEKILQPALLRSIEVSRDFLARLMQMSGVMMGAGFVGSMQYDVKMQAMLQALNQVPDTGEIHELADYLRDAFNKTCAGTGLVTATKVATEYIRVKEILDIPELYTQCGVANRDELVREMNLQVPGALVRAEENLTAFVYAMIELDEVSADVEPAYVVQMCNLATRIDTGVLFRPLDSIAPTGKAAPAADAGVIEVEGEMIDGAESARPAMNAPRDGKAFTSVTGAQLLSGSL